MQKKHKNTKSKKSWKCEKIKNAKSFCTRYEYLGTHIYNYVDYKLTNFELMSNVKNM